MNTRKDVSEWERANMNLIIGWRYEYDVNPGIIFITFDYKDLDGCKKIKVFEVINDKLK